MSILKLIPLKWPIIALVIGLAFFGYGKMQFNAGQTQGHQKSTDHYAPLLAAANAALDTIATTTTQTKLKQDKDNAKLFIDAEDRTNRIHVYYKRLLNSGKDSSVSNSTSSGEQVYGEADPPFDSEATGQIHLEYQCTIVAAQLKEWLDWRVTHGVPVE